MSKVIDNGATFEVAGIEFIKFPYTDGMVAAVARNILFRSTFGENNNLTTSKVLRTLQSEILPSIIKTIGEENVCEFETDLTTLDGLKPYPVLESKISLPTLDFYRQNVEIFDKYKVNSWWWLATPESSDEHSNSNWTLCVSPGGGIYCNFYNFISGVRPFLIFKSSIFESFLK
ncbi:MAG: hypothetical protein IKB88_02065 [Clostridia bacterium]|nr:hypothetical protein [Clostridia bacterium]